MVNRKTAFWLLFILAVSVLVVVAASRAASAEVLYVCTSGDDLNGRARPDPHARVEMHIPNGDSVQAVSRVEGWVEVVGGETGTVWCAQQYLSSSKEAAKYRNTSGGRVFVRDDVQGAKNGLVVSNNKVVTVRRQLSGWGFIGTGWVDLQYFSKED